MPVTLSVQVKGAEIVRRGLQNLRLATPKIGAQTIYDAMLRIQRRLKQPGGPITYPVHWDSERQRRAFFATGGFGRGIPSTRTGTYQRGWMIRRNPSTVRVQAGYSLINNTREARFVGGSAYGDGQSRIHRGRWVRLRDITDEELRDLPKTIQRSIDMVARREGLTR